MFRITGPGLSATELKQVKFEAAKRTKFPSYDKNSAWSSTGWNNLKSLWENFAGPVRDTEHFMVCQEHGDEACSVIEYDHGEISVEIVDNEILETEAADLMPLIKPVMPLAATRKTPPNSPCACGSGRKSKKCCGA